MNIGSAELHHTECYSGSLKTFRIFPGYCPKLLTFNLKLYFKGENCLIIERHPTECNCGFILMLRPVMNTWAPILGTKLTQGGRRNSSPASHHIKAGILTCPGFPFSHRKASCSDANSGALSFTSRTLIATGTRDTWLWFPKERNQSTQGQQNELGIKHSTACTVTVLFLSPALA